VAGHQGGRGVGAAAGHAAGDGDGLAQVDVDPGGPRGVPGQQGGRTRREVALVEGDAGEVVGPFAVGAQHGPPRRQAGADGDGDLDGEGDRVADVDQAVVPVAAGGPLRELQVHRRGDPYAAGGRGVHET